MLKVINKIDLQNLRLGAVSGGVRRNVGKFTGEVKIYEKTTDVPLSGCRCVGIKRMYARLVACDKESYFGSMNIHSGMVFDASGEMERTDGVFETLHFAGLRMEDSDPRESTVTFEIPDYELVRKLEKM